MAREPRQALPEGFAAPERPSAFGGLVGPVLDAQGQSRRGFRVEAKHLNNAGIAHGGMLMSLADMTLGRGASDATGGPAVTVRMVSDFHGPARLGDWVEGQARVTRTTRTMVFVEAEVRANGRLILSASGVFRRLRQR